MTTFKKITLLFVMTLSIGLVGCGSDEQQTLTKSPEIAETPSRNLDFSNPLLESGFQLGEYRLSASSDLTDCLDTDVHYLFRGEGFDSFNFQMPLESDKEQFSESALDNSYIDNTTSENVSHIWSAVLFPGETGKQSKLALMSTIRQTGFDEFYQFDVEISVDTVEITVGECGGEPIVLEFTNQN